MLPAGKANTTTSLEGLPHTTLLKMISTFTQLFCVSASDQVTGRIGFVGEQNSSDNMNALLVRCCTFERKYICNIKMGHRLDLRSDKGSHQVSNEKCFLTNCIRNRNCRHNSLIVKNVLSLSICREKIVFIFLQWR